MNERIQKLAEQAGFFPELDYDHTGWHAAGHDPLFEKFAELIVRECLSYAKDGDIDFMKFMIKKHFGVE